MPQDIPAEASETLAFTPPCLANCDDPPRFILRAVTKRDERFFRRLSREQGITRHSDEALRAEILSGLERLWSPADFAEHKPVLEAYWQTLDEFVAQRKDDPDLKWEYDPDIERAITVLVEKVQDAHAPLRRMLADNLDADEMTPKLMLAIAVKSWEGLDVARELDRGYITLDCAETLQEALRDYEKVKLGEKVPAIAGTELFVACVRRFRLDEEEEKNSASPSPSETIPPPSETGTESSDGTSPASATSKKTRADA